MFKSKAAPYIFLLALALVTFAIVRWKRGRQLPQPRQEDVRKKADDRRREEERNQPQVSDNQRRRRNDPPSEQDTRSAGLNRRLEPIVYSKHARCRMGCRHIDDAEVREILAVGKINYKKSDLGHRPCSNKYAVEGYSRDRQHLRIVVAPCDDGMHVVTVIDLGEDWKCDCK
jgi:Domain of unknown function (DUF4258)